MPTLITNPLSPLQTQPAVRCQESHSLGQHLRTRHGANSPSCRRQSPALHLRQETKKPKHTRQQVEAQGTAHQPHRGVAQLPEGAKAVRQGKQGHRAIGTLAGGQNASQGKANSSWTWVVKAETRTMSRKFQQLILKTAKASIRGGPEQHSHVPSATFSALCPQKQ